ncbi:hypothetical protein ASG25_05430 [Rhizobium sp. Leaf384]|uniref:hypothetical protein n=1 Tax=unclassified Rhizobium TaxID=2613769 RepID=UPI0007128088|nr:MULTISPECIES: hypothetical protein [unclassified Rhizobium]KQR77739.1 hypothetical protein ASG03_15265 [Rhizobium sp. Leaf341]KQS80956.1 hypothetical protein ASG25_05430 [Rhizobium sp. Leaf384]KQS86816.1 hypothetical protein ASG58_00730 [Rhizobium sp. Leaf383]
MTAPLSRYLKDFSTPKVDLTRVPKTYFPEIEEPISRDTRPLVKAPPEPVIDIEAERQSAYGRGREHAEMEMRARHQAEIAALRAEHEAECEAIRERLENQAAAMIHQRFSEIGSLLAGMICEQTAQVLAPILQETLADKAVESLAAAIRHSIDGEAVKITVRGPARMFEALETRLSGTEVTFRHVETDDIDLSAEFGDSILMTRLSAWADTVRKVIA